MFVTMEPFYRGDTRMYQVQVKDEDDAPVIITDWILSSSMKLSTEQSDDEAPVLVHLVVPEYSGREGLGYVEFSPEQTRNLVPTMYRIDFQLESPSGVVTTLLSGEVEVLADVTWGAS